jgi:hypothetical protein
MFHARQVILEVGENPEDIADEEIRPRTLNW